MYDGLVHQLSGLADPHEAALALSPGKRALVALLYVDAVISNGGFAALFYNPSGEWWRSALEGAELVGAREHAALLRRAGALSPDGELPTDREERNAILEALPAHSPVIDELDDEWDTSRPSLQTRLLAYAQLHPAEFDDQRGSAARHFANPS